MGRPEAGSHWDGTGGAEFPVRAVIDQILKKAVVYEWSRRTSVRSKVSV